MFDSMFPTATFIVLLLGLPHAPFSSPYKSKSVAEASQRLRMSTRLSRHDCVGAGSNTYLEQISNGCVVKCDKKYWRIMVSQARAGESGHKAET
mmetsp:Transcript_7396/g.14038  ORF Transcript_7396/g.14038 Transcript_7396/m.14038 type:complete len:94 (+) Transcript_7396:1655-1936(+)